MKIKTLLLATACMLPLASCGGTGSTTSTTTPTSTTEPVKTYTVKWVVEGEVVETDTGLKAGDMPSYDGETPVKEVAEEEKAEIATYVFTGWTPEVVAVTADATYTATFEAVTTKAACYAACVACVANIFGEPSVESLVKDDWATAAVGLPNFYFAAAIGEQAKPEEAAKILDSVLVTEMEFAAIEPMALDEKTGRYVGTYFHVASGVVAYPLTYLHSTAGTVLQTIFTHSHFLG